MGHFCIKGLFFVGFDKRVIMVNGTGIVLVQDCSRGVVLVLLTIENECIEIILKLVKELAPPLPTKKLVTTCD